MGNTGTNSTLDESQHKINHPRLKQVKYKKNNEIMQVKLNVEDMAQFQKWQNKLATLKKFDQYYLLLPKIYQYNKTGMCGSSGMLQIDYDNYPLILTDQIHNRSNNHNYFNQTELWYLLYGLVSSSSMLKKLGNKIGDVRSHNIFMNNQGQIKISNVYSWPNQRTNYQKLLFQNTLTYVAPEQLEYVRQGRTDLLKDNFNGKQKYNKYVAESFSIGLTMLEAMLLNSSSTMYNVAERSIDKEELQRRVQKILLNNSTHTSNPNNINNTNIKYSKCLRMIVAGLCQYSQQDRLNSIDVYQQIKCYDNQLINLKQCNIQTPAIQNKNKYQQLILGNVNKIQSIVNNTYNTNTLANTYNNQTGTNPSEIYQNNTNKYNNGNNYNYNTNINTSNNNINSSFNHVNTSIKFNNYTKSIPTYNANSNINTYNTYTNNSNTYNPNFNTFSTYANSNINTNTYNNLHLNSYNFKYDNNTNKNTYSINNYSDNLLYNSEDANNKIGTFTSNNYYTSPITTSIDKYQYLYPSSLTNNTSYPYPTSTNVPASNINKSLLTVNISGLPTIQQVVSNKTSVQTKNQNIQVIESANNYLKSVYGISSTVQTPTFNTNTNSINNTINSYNKNTTTFNYIKDNNNNLPPIPQSNSQKSIQQQDIKLTTTTKTINNQSNNTYTFSNISSIPKYQYSYQSANKIGDNIAMFTPTHPSVNKNININENDDDGINLLKKINQDVNRSKEQYQ